MIPADRRRPEACPRCTTVHSRRRVTVVSRLGRPDRFRADYAFSPIRDTREEAYADMCARMLACRVALNNVNRRDRELVGELYRLGLTPIAPSGPMVEVMTGRKGYARG